MRTTRLLKKLNRETVAQVFYAGEFARDIIRRKKVDNIEIVVRNLPLKDIIKYLRKDINILYVNKSRGYLVFKVKNGNGREVKMSLPQKRGRCSHRYTLKDDALCRDFTINAMYLPIHSKSKKAVMDFFDGLKDIKGRKIKAVGNAKLATNRHPIRMLMAVSLSAETNYRIDNNLFYAMKANHPLLKKVPRITVRDELIKILLSNKPSRYLKILNDSGLLFNIMPELSMCVGVTQNERYHKYDVFQHCIMACDNINPELMLRLAALMHDIGKPQTREEAKGRMTFYNHEVMSSRLAKKILRRLKFDKELISQIPELIYRHMYNYEPGKWSDAAVRRFIKNVSLTNDHLADLDSFPLFLIRKADRLSSGQNYSAIAPRQHAFQERIEKVFTKTKALNVSDLDIDGTTIMQEFKLKPGPTVGNILNHLLSLVIEDQKLNKRNLLIEATSEYLSEALK